ncbi:hypothetical protein CKAH01_01897 [Colletotrichum kahawae]|uniref:Uncharacterized protein n=1 Tax=Colletotrichum kahawae TaxID=34407 RepID=A0AAD9Y4P7_COLKA|nr:hypothetical protein CKAH01_01897 [Colletotrichum kahawae]
MTTSAVHVQDPRSSRLDFPSSPCPDGSLTKSTSSRI